MIGKDEILRNYHDHAIVIAFSNVKESLLERVYFKDMKTIEYQ